MEIPASIQALWLCSWYPDLMQPQNGDFVQRQANAASLYANIAVIHIAPADITLVNQKKADSNCKDHSLNENIVYYIKKSNSLQNRIKSVYQYFSIYKKWIDNYIAEHGKPDIIHVNVAWRDGLVALWIKKKYKVPFVLTEHWSFYHKEDGMAYKNASFFFRYWTKKILQNASYVLPVSRHLGNVLTKIYPNPHLQIVNNVVNTALFHYQKKGKKDVFRFLHVSSLDPIKNVPGIINAFREVLKSRNDVELYIVGGKQEEIDRMANLPSQIIMVSNMPYAKVADYMKSADCFVLFSFSENQPCVILEALSCGVPVISSDVGGVKEIINSNNGILVSSRNEKQLAAAMYQMVENTEKYDHQQISNNAIQKYSYESVGRQINNIYKEVINSFQKE